jgi:hypothetical protein
VALIRLPVTFYPVSGIGSAVNTTGGIATLVAKRIYYRNLETGVIYSRVW